jgi:hypothetical protein
MMTDELAYVASFGLEPDCDSVLMAVGVDTDPSPHPLDGYDLTEELAYIASFGLDPTPPTAADLDPEPHPLDGYDLTEELAYVASFGLDPTPLSYTEPDPNSANSHWAAGYDSDELAWANHGDSCTDLGVGPVSVSEGEDVDYSLALEEELADVESWGMSRDRTTSLEVSDFRGRGITEAVARARFEARFDGCRYAKGRGWIPVRRTRTGAIDKRYLDSKGRTGAIDGRARLISRGP